MNKYGYKAFYNNKTFDIWTDKGLYGAKLEAIKHFNPPKSKQHLITVILCEKPNGENITHVANF